MGRGACLGNGLGNFCRHGRLACTGVRRRLVADEQWSVARRVDACCRHRPHSGGAVAHRCRRAGPPRDDRVRGPAEEGVRRRRPTTNWTGSAADLPGIATTAPRVGPGRPAPSTLLLAIMSGFERRGRWNVPKRLTSFALLRRRRDRPALRRLHLGRRGDPLVLDLRRPDDPAAAGGQRRRPGRRA